MSTMSRASQTYLIIHECDSNNKKDLIRMLAGCNLVIKIKGGIVSMLHETRMLTTF